MVEFFFAPCILLTADDDGKKASSYQKVTNRDSVLCVPDDICDVNELPAVGTSSSHLNLVVGNRTAAVAARSRPAQSRHAVIEGDDLGCSWLTRHICNVQWWIDYCHSIFITDSWKKILWITSAILTIHYAAIVDWLICITGAITVWIFDCNRWSHVRWFTHSNLVNRYNPELVLVSLVQVCYSGVCSADGLSVNAAPAWAEWCTLLNDVALDLGTSVVTWYIPADAHSGLVDVIDHQISRFWWCCWKNNHKFCQIGSLILFTITIRSCDIRLSGKCQQYCPVMWR